MSLGSDEEDAELRISLERLALAGGEDGAPETRPRGCLCCWCRGWRAQGC